VRFVERGNAARNLSTAELVERAIAAGEGHLTSTGALAVTTGEHTGRSPGDKFIVDDGEASQDVWWDSGNQRFDPIAFQGLRRKVEAYLAGRQTYTQDLRAGADPTYQLRVNVVSERAWAALFARNLFIVPDEPESPQEASGGEFTVLHAPDFQADPEADGTASSTVIVISFRERMVIIAGTQYAGEIKKSIFSVLQYLLPARGVATMHCSANAGVDGDTAIFFGLSGTGKTTLSTDPTRVLIGDDEHGWTEKGIFNFEGGSYAKTINLSAEAEPGIYAASNRFGTVLENVVVDDTTHLPDFTDERLTENTRAAFPISYIDGASSTGRGGHPSNLIMLTADAFGVLPPVARLSPDQALYYFLSGYTSKLAGTELGVTEPEATFSACFGAPFLTRHPVEYARLLGERIRRHEPAVWLVNTGWTGGAYGVGERMSIAHTRAIIQEIVTGSLRDVPVSIEPVFGLAIPERCGDVPVDVLHPACSWKDSTAYLLQARALAGRFAVNFRVFEGEVEKAIAEAGPQGV